MAGSVTPRIAIVCDWLYGGGAEKVVLELHHMYPDAPIYTSYCSDEWRSRLDNKVATGYLQYWPFAQTRKFLPLLRQWWFGRLDLSQFDLVISCTGNGEAKFIRVRGDAQHLCYCFTPPHFYWRKYHEYLKTPGMGTLDPLARLGLKLLVKPLRNRDYRAAQRVTEFISISSHIQADIQTYYGRDSAVIHPPVDTTKLTATEHQKHTGSPRVIWWGRHVPYKRVDLVIAACNELELPLTIIGRGPETTKLQAIAGPTVRFTGFVPDNKLPELAGESDLFVFPSEEDFGIAPVEALALGLPILAYDSGGAQDYVIPGKTGDFFGEQRVSSITDALKKFKPSSYKPAQLRKTAESFSGEVFRHKLTAVIQKIQKH